MPMKIDFEMKSIPRQTKFNQSKLLKTRIWKFHKTE